MSRQLILFNAKMKLVGAVREYKPRFLKMKASNPRPASLWRSENRLRVGEQWRGRSSDHGASMHRSSVSYRSPRAYCTDRVDILPMTSKQRQSHRLLYVGSPTLSTVFRNRSWAAHQGCSPASAWVTHGQSTGSLGRPMSALQPYPGYS